MYEQKYRIKIQTKLYLDPKTYTNTTLDKPASFVGRYFVDGKL